MHRKIRGGHRKGRFEISKRKKRVWTPELQGRWQIKERFERLGLNQGIVAAEGGISGSSISRWLNGDTGESEKVEGVILRAIEAKEGENESARKMGQLVYV